jgi:hypothetical protein
LDFWQLFLIALRLTHAQLQQLFTTVGITIEQIIVEAFIVIGKFQQHILIFRVAPG